MNKQELIDAIGEALDGRDALDASTHQSHHQYVADLITRNQRRRNTVDKIRAQVGGWVVVVAISAIGLLIWGWFQQLVHKVSAGS